MARIVFEGNYKVYWATSVASKSAPSVGSDFTNDITEFVPKDGLQYGPGFTKVDASNIASAFDPQYQGSWSMDASLTIQIDDTTNTAWDLFATHPTAGYLIVLPQATDSSPATSDTAYVLPCEASIAVPNNTAANSLQTATVDLAITEEPDFNATLAA